VDLHGRYIASPLGGGVGGSGGGEVRHQGGRCGVSLAQDTRTTKAA